MDAEEGAKCLSTHLKQAAVPLRALSFMTAEGRREKKEREDKRIERERGKTCIAIISRSSVGCDTMGTKTDNHPKACGTSVFAKGLGCTLFHKAFYFISNNNLRLIKTS